MKRKVFLCVTADESRYLVIGTCLILLSLTGLAYLSGVEYPWLIGITALAFLPPSFALIGYYWAKWKVARYREVFYIPLDQNLVAQSWINGVLISRASEMRMMFDMENQAVERITASLRADFPYLVINDVLERSPSVAQAREESRECKKRFWEAHELAELMGFETRKSFKDYLNPKLAA